jgi:hypothetical protein
VSDHADGLKDQHMHNSTLRERIVEHVFVGESLRLLWRRGVVDVEVLRSEFDAHGYDLVMSRGDIVRHIQFKTGVRPKPEGSVSIARSLAAKPSGCVIWISVSSGLYLSKFWWFGGPAGEKLPDVSGFSSPLRIGRRQGGDRPLRAAHIKIPPSRFRRLDTLDVVLETLFGPLPSLGVPEVDEGNESDEGDEGRGIE